MTGSEGNQWSGRPQLQTPASNRRSTATPCGTFDSLSVKMTDEYPELPANPLKAWECAPLHMCSSRRMLQIGKDFGLTGISSLQKADLFIRVYDHMFQIDECPTCEGTCSPTNHMFPPTQEKPDATTPDTSPNGRRTRQNASPSPTRMAALGDNSNDAPLGDPNAPLFEGQHQLALPVLVLLWQTRLTREPAS